jgi:glucuronokinase
MEPTLRVFERRFDDSKGFEATVETTIPRQVGLAGSSAIETAFFLGLMAHNNIPLDTLSSRELAELVLKVESEELGMVAGLQDCLPLAHGCMLHMDFRQELMEGRGYGEYTELDSSLLPPLWLAHAPRGKDSGETHAGLASRWEIRDSEMVEIVGHLAQGAASGVDSIRNGEHTHLSMLIDTNFDLRRELFGEQALGETLDAVMLARSLGSCAKQTGSGGAIFGIAPHDDFSSTAAPAFAEIGWTFHDDLEVGN